MAVPKLRFPEYKDGKEWGNTTIGQEGTFYYGKSAPKWSITEDAKTPCIRYGELYTKHNIIVKEISSYTNIDPQNLKFSKGNEVLVPRVGEDPLDFHKCAYLPFKNVAIGEMISVYNTDNNPLFMSYYFNATMKYKFARYVEGGNVSNLYYVYLKNIKIHMPDYMEQRKIADFLATFDKSITTQQNIIADLEETKKGLLQKIFSQEIRFKDDNGQNYPEWKKTLLDDIIVCFSGGTPKSDEKDYYVGNIPFIRSGEIHKVNTELHISEEGLANSSAKMVKKGDLLYALYGANSGECDISKVNGAINQAVLCIRPIKDDVYYIFLWLSYFRQHIISTFLQGGQGNLSATIIKRLSVMLPCMEEQQKIADFLSTFDKKITAEKQILSDLQEMKKGLLQQMFV